MYCIIFIYGNYVLTMVLKNQIDQRTIFKPRS